MNDAVAPTAADWRYRPGVVTPRRADQGDGSFRNPIVAGDHPDPTVLKDGADYYMSFSALQSSPAAVIWHSRDLVNWAPITAALTQPLGSVWAMDLVKHGGRYFIYLPVLRHKRVALYVIHADDIRGPWSDPVDLKLDGCLDPAHAVGEDGRRHLFVNGVRRIALSDDGLATIGSLEAVHRLRPGSCDAEPDSLAAEGPRLLRRGGFFYMLSAVSSPGADSHVLAVARSTSVLGPWEDCPFDPMAGIASSGQAWRTGGHPSLAEGPAGDWWMVCHGYEDGYRTLGRQALLQPVDWTRDGWFRVSGEPLDRRQRKPGGGQASPAAPGPADELTLKRLGLQWRFFDAAADEFQRARDDGRGLVLRGKGTGLADCSPLTCVVADHSYEAELEFELVGNVQGGLALFHDARGFVGIGIGDGRMHTYSYGQAHRWMQQPVPGRRHRLRLTNHRHLISFEHASGEGPWVPNPWLQAVSALHQNVFGGLHSLKLAVFAAGDGEVRLHRFSYRGQHH
ncbi:MULTISPECIES: family 43 glycosylhydrolase [unclassified Roseateles]|uniref:family 43 glycosylhydrolase n=1 Tax=unclassified Roseateles TaxID=2626991 RepID=UPI0006F32620|nr:MULTISPECIES: family 43 glycosylhydrolase [unclassified Roseateles]KQW49774.1 hypothetical protein ASC81_25030 [Pelomonas sp. Root405]KRA76441.1 hypothetical protein ASD88_24985 [Pelomonas sp. Root662]